MAICIKEQLLRYCNYVRTEIKRSYIWGLNMKRVVIASFFNSTKNLLFAFNPRITLLASEPISSSSSFFFFKFSAFKLLFSFNYACDYILYLLCPQVQDPPSFTLDKHFDNRVTVAMAWTTTFLMEPCLLG